LAVLRRHPSTAARMVKDVPSRPADGSVEHWNSTRSSAQSSFNVSPRSSWDPPPSAPATPMG
jgi:hypothetical protein